MFERFTDRARRVIVLAQDEAKLLNHNYIGTEHVLLGLVREGEGVAAQVLIKMGIDLGRIRSTVMQLMQGYQQTESRGPEPVEVGASVGGRTGANPQSNSVLDQF